MKPLIILLIPFIIFSCKQKKEIPVYLGMVDFEVTGNEEALPHFEKGLLLLHSFEYEDAREAFGKAQDADPHMAMAYWGEAMTYNHGLWREQDYQDGIDVIEKIKQLDKTDLTTVERDLLEAVDVLYKPKTPKSERDQAYMDKMKSLYGKYPNHNEIAAFYALSLLGSTSDGRNDSIYGQGAIVANKVLEKNSQHPGALHYLIHSYDDPNHAHLALEAANSYAKVAPDASHALHMPSHIYVALGMWDKVISSNIDSYEASIMRMEEKGLDNDARGYHAFHWLQYGYLQKNNIVEAEKMVWDMQKFCEEKPSKRARAHLLFLKGTFLAETGLWDHSISNIEIDDSGINISLKAQNYFIEGMKAYTTKNLDGLDGVIKRLEDEIAQESLLVENLSRGGTVCASANRSMPSREDVEQAEVCKLQLLGLLKWSTNDLENANKFFMESIELNDRISYSYGPPVIIIPPRELYAKFLYENNRHRESAKLYEQALKRGPKRLNALKGLEESNKFLTLKTVSESTI